MSGLEQAVALCGGQRALAARLGLRQGHIWAWLNRTGKVPPEQVLAVVRATAGAVRPYDLRPDLYPDPDWVPPALDAEAGGEA